jgi:hypothetical protein
MRKRRRFSKNNSGLVFLVLIAIVTIWSTISSIATFIQQNIILIIILVGLIFFIFVLSIVFSDVIKWIKINKVTKNYLNTPYFIDNKVPFSRLRKDKGSLFEIEIYDRLKNEFKNDIQIIHNLLIPKLNSVNEYSEIDLIAIHTSGIYIIEAKNFSGPVTGKDDDDYWKPFVEDVDRFNKQGYKQNYAIKGFNQYGLYNPIKQNEEHIRSLNALIPNSYSNKVIFSDSMLIGRSNHPKIHSISELIELLRKTQIIKYNSNELVTIKENILKIKVTDPRAINLHIARLSKN